MAYPGNSTETGDPEDRAVQMSGHIVVCGLEDVGLRVVEQLRRGGEQVVLVDDRPNPRLLPIALELGAEHLSADPRRPASLEAASIGTAAALISVDGTDLENLEIALLARRLAPDLRVVSQLGNAAVARAVGGLTGPGSVLDVASLAAPTLAEACLDLHTRPLTIGDEPFVLREVAAPSAGTLRSHFGDLAPIAVVPTDPELPMQVCPGRDLPVTAGDRVFVIATPDDLAARRELTAVVATPHARPHPHRLGTLRRYVRGFIAETERPMRATLTVLLGVAVLSVVLLRFGYRAASGAHMTVLDSAYFTTETLTTVGFGDFYFADQSTWLRVWAIALMIIGATLVTILYAMLTNLLVSRRIAQSLGRQLAVRMRDHVILVGLGSVGVRVLEQLVQAGRQVVVLDRDEDNRYLARARALDVPVVFGDSTEPSTLDAVGLQRARAVAVLTSSDLANIETGLVIDDLLGERRDEVPVVLRVFDRDLADTVEAGFGFHSVRSTAALAAPWFVGAALGLDILTTFYVDKQPMLIGRLTVAEAGGLRGRTMAELSARIRVIAIRRRDSGPGLEYPPRRDTRFAGGDQAYLVGPYEELLAVLRRDAARG
ncbi:NAD-binding protein [Jatrophihabitans endophyticus]|uniref:NAD-binding protein n=1 Tax=Jatrophihabitans endophyticus TaxID=1206085 RepID=UPI0019F0DF15|nr:NAD-binding protein [Jatrophihabitans endophyticus]MBE7187350.1 NAD-binding protein [Jatrophihabitans endophyticus]